MIRSSQIDDSSPRVLLTGSTGMLGVGLLVELLRRGFQVLAVARPRGRLGASERLHRLLSAHGVDVGTDRVEVIDTELEGGLRASLSKRRPLDAVVHAAAAVKFTTPFAELLRQNVTATENVLEAIYELAPTAEVHFVSTAYVGGCQRGTFQETDHSIERSFHHPYEETKLLAERAVTRHCLGTRRPFSIYRPSIIAGSSRDGSAANFNGIYALLRTLDNLAREESGPTAGFGAEVLFRCDPEATKNIVAVDWVASSIGALIQNGACGKTYHLTHPRPLSHAEILAIVRQLPGLEKLKASARADGNTCAHRAQRLVDRSLRELAPYLWGEPRFDRTHLEAELGAAAEPPPVDLAYFSRLLEFGRRKKWRERPFEAASLSKDVGAPKRPSSSTKTAAT